MPIQGHYYYLFIFLIWLLYFLNNRLLIKKAKKKYDINHLLIDIPIGIFSFYFFLKLIFKFFLYIFYKMGFVFSDTDNITYISYIIKENVNIPFYLALIIQLLGILFSLFSIILFIYIVHFEKNFPSCISTAKGEKLSGIYNYIRHPSYIVFFLLLFGTSFYLLDKYLFLMSIFCHISLYIYFI